MTQHTCTTTATTVDGQPPPPCPACQADPEKLPKLPMAPITFMRGLFRCKLVAKPLQELAAPSDATPVDLLAAGFTPTAEAARVLNELQQAHERELSALRAQRDAWEQHAKRFEQRMKDLEHDLLDIAEHTRGDWTSRTEQGGKAMVRVSALLDDLSEVTTGETAVVAAGKQTEGEEVADTRGLQALFEGFCDDAFGGEYQGDEQERLYEVLNGAYNKGAEQWSEKLQAAESQLRDLTAKQEALRDSVDRDRDAWNALHDKLNAQNRDLTAERLQLLKLEESARLLCLAGSTQAPMFSETLKRLDALRSKPSADKAKEGGAKTADDDLANLVDWANAGLETAIGAERLRDPKIRDVVRALFNEHAKIRAQIRDLSSLVGSHGGLVRSLLLNECQSARNSSQLTRQLELTSALTLWQRLMDAEGDALRSKPSADSSPVWTQPELDAVEAEGAHLFERLGKLSADSEGEEANVQEARPIHDTQTQTKAHHHSEANPRGPGERREGGAGARQGDAPELQVAEPNQIDTSAAGEAKTAEPWTKPSTAAQAKREFDGALAGDVQTDPKSARLTTREAVDKFLASGDDLAPKAAFAVGQMVLVGRYEQPGELRCIDGDRMPNCYRVKWSDHSGWYEHLKPADPAPPAELPAEPDWDQDYWKAEQAQLNYEHHKVLHHVLLLLARKFNIESELSKAGLP